MPFLRLLAKSCMDPDRPEYAATLAGHMELVADAAGALLAARGVDTLASLGLDQALLGRLHANLTLAAWVHDLGKCSVPFQELVRSGASGRPQLATHDILGLWLMTREPLASWLRCFVSGDLDFSMVLAAVAGHHRRFPERVLADEGSGAGSSITCLTSHPDFRLHLLRMRSALCLVDPPVFEVDLDVNRRDLERFRRFLTLPGLTEAPDTATRRLLGATKALLVAADVAGSALPRVSGASHWVGDALCTRASSADFLDIAARRVGPRRVGDLREVFQQAVEDCDAPVTLVRAGCGSGKTVAAYRWAARYGGRQLWFAYPTTGTATEGFRDYLTDLEGARLEHSRSVVDLEILSSNDGAPRHDQRVVDRLAAIRGWASPEISCTVDTVLGLLQNQRKGLYAWPGLARSVIVFDEIHAYDGRMFGGLLRFLTDLPGVPVLLMTASLPRARLTLLQDVVRQVHGQELASLEGPPALERLPRYRRSLVEDPWSEVEDTLRAGGKVLRVCNTVNRCLEEAAWAEARGIRVAVYHSRFRYCDRVRRHAAVVDGFRSPEPLLAVTTQVAEMSLDLSANLLVTDLAPIPSLIQRLGRLNRRARPQEAPGDQPPRVEPFVVVDPGRSLPYRDGELAVARTWLERFGTNPISQSDLVDRWEHLPAAEEQVDTGSAWLDGCLETRADPVREGSVGVTVLLPDDAARVRAGLDDPVRVSLPMDLPPGWPRTPMNPSVRGYLVPRLGDIEYHETRGARWVGKQA